MQIVIAMGGLWPFAPIIQFAFSLFFPRADHRERPGRMCTQKPGLARLDAEQERRRACALMRVAPCRDLIPGLSGGTGGEIPDLISIT